MKCPVPCPSLQPVCPKPWTLELCLSLLDPPRKFRHGEKCSLSPFATVVLFILVTTCSGDLLLANTCLVLLLVLIVVVAATALRSRRRNPPRTLCQSANFKTWTSRGSRPKLCKATHFIYVLFPCSTTRLKLKPKDLKACWYSGPHNSQ